MNLVPLREKIDALDQQLVDLINRRLALAAEIGRIKRSAGGEIYVPEREDAVLRQVCAHNAGPIKPEALRAIYREIMSAAIALEKPLSVAYLGPEASNTHAAALKKFGASVDYQALGAIADIFTAVEKGEADLAVIPIENSTEGSVRETLDSFVETAPDRSGAMPTPTLPPAGRPAAHCGAAGRAAGGRGRELVGAPRAGRGRPFGRPAGPRRPSGRGRPPGRGPRGPLHRGKPAGRVRGEPRTPASSPAPAGPGRSTSRAAPWSGPWPTSVRWRATWCCPGTTASAR